MMRRPSIPRTLVAALAVPLALSGCISLAPKPPKLLLTLTPTATPAPGMAQNSATTPTITVMVPVIPQSLATARIPVQTGQAIAYLTDVYWVEPPQRLFARLMADTITAQTGRVVLSSAQSFADPGARLSGELRTFGIDGTTSEAVVTYDAALTRGDATKIEKRRFEARVPLATINATTAGPALDQAANSVAAQVAAWVGK